MRNYSNWMTQSSSPEDMVFDLAEKSTVKVNNSLTLNEVIVNDANEWQKDVDLIWLVKKAHYVPSFGDYIEFDGNHYLSIFQPEERVTFWSSKVRLCNSTFPIQSDKTQVSLVDEFGNPILNEFGEEQYEWVDGGTENVPCIVESRITSADTNEAINLPEGRLNVTIPFRQHPDIVEGKEFSMYESTYQIMGIDYTKSLNNTGLLIIQGKKV